MVLQNVDDSTDTWPRARRNHSAVVYEDHMCAHAWKPVHCCQVPVQQMNSGENPLQANSGEEFFAGQLLLRQCACAGC